ncbi:MAG TPA: hypothetical protein VJV03_05815 [Pyrinomonadaceae bacterium]|nr:hypothetical protein [Pyrinomonadaceae bacterium]
MIRLRFPLALVLMLVLFVRITPPGVACGPSTVEPIFIFRESPDLPFTDFVNGNIGVVLPTFGHKTLVIAYRYLNGIPFSAAEQRELVLALKGSPPEDGKDEPVKHWIAARQEFVGKDEPVPEIYQERQYGGYDFFPNCAANAFQVATETLRDRAARFDAKDVSEWLAAQDTVFKNCSSGSHLPAEVSMDRPEWLRKDRDYQKAAALFYSVRLDEARASFAAIAADVNSPWQETAEYLVARSLVRQASLTGEEAKKRQLYEEAELKAEQLVSTGRQFSNASKRLLGLVKYRVHPEERVGELARSLSFERENTNVRQDLIDYVWLLGKFENQVLKEQAEQRRGPLTEIPEPPFMEDAARYKAIQRGEIMEISLYPNTTEQYSPVKTIDFKPDVSESMVLETFARELGRELTAEERKQVLERRESQRAYRNWLLSPNRQLEVNSYEGDRWGERAKLPRQITPAFLVADDLGDWVLTVETDDPASYEHAFNRWRHTGSHAWLLAALMKAKKGSPGLPRLMRAAQTVDRDLPVFAGSFYHLIRLKVETGRKSEARVLLDGLTKADLERLPVSSQNLFAEQRLRLAEDLDVFLRAGLQTPVAFYDDGRLGTLPDLFTTRKEDWDPKFHLEDKGAFERRVDEEYQRRLEWKDRALLDDTTTAILNTHFPLPLLLEVSRNPAVPDYLRRRIALTVFTRALVLQKPRAADQVAADIGKADPAFKPFLSPYLSAKTPREKEWAALFMILKNQRLSPLIDGQLSRLITEDATSDDNYLSYYYESAWWCPPSLTEYSLEGEAVPKNIPMPQFLTPAQVAEAKKDFTRLIDIGDAKSYLGKRVLEWAKAARDDPRIPEALFITVRANASYKYGCDSWSHDGATMNEAERLLRTRYPDNAWTAKLKEKIR